MKTILHHQRVSSIVAALVTIALGLVLLLWPDRSVKFLCMLLGVSILLTGVIYSLGWLARRGDGRPAFFVLPGVILCALGLWLMTSPASVVLLVQYIFGAILLLHGAIDLQAAFSLIGRRWRRCWIDLLLGLLTAALGVLILLNPLGTFSALVLLIGAALIFDGLSDLYIIWQLTRAFHGVEPAPSEEAQEDEH